MQSEKGRTSSSPPQKVVMQKKISSNFTVPAPPRWRSELVISAKL